MNAAVEVFVEGRGSQRPVAKRDLVLGLCAGRSVLDVGCVQHSWRMAVGNPRWLHEAIRSVASRCVGVDYLEDDVATLRDLGYDIVVGDVLRDEPPGRFERVVLGDILEHVEDPATLLRYTASALTADGLAVVTTPNPFYLGQFLTIGARCSPTVNPEHVAFYDPRTLVALVERSPLEIVELRWLTPSFPALWDSRHRLVRRVVSPGLHRLGGAIRSRRPYLNSDFAAILRRRHDVGAMSAPDRAARVMDFHRVG